MRAKHVRQLGDVAKPAPYGKRTETILDAAVRNALGIDATKVELSAALRGAIDDQLPVIERGLGLPPGHVKAELCTLLIYPIGGRFRKHRDSEKRKGMVASLIVVLPSKFKRGSLLFWEKDRPRRFDVSQARLEETAEYVAFYADYQHEVERVESGVRNRSPEKHSIASETALAKEKRPMKETIFLPVLAMRFVDCGARSTLSQENHETSSITSRGFLKG